MKKGKTIKVESEDMLVGDRLEQAFKPIVAVIEQATGVDLTDCGGCASTKESLGSAEKRPDPPIV
jgi:hypothetical protein